MISVSQYISDSLTEWPQSVSERSALINDLNKPVNVCVNDSSVRECSTLITGSYKCDLNQSVNSLLK